MPANRVILSQPPPVEVKAKDLWSRGFWSAQWVRLPGDPRPPFVSAYRLRFSLAQAGTVRIHVAADERYILHLDGRFIGRGNDRGHLDRWAFDSYDLDLRQGTHELFAWVWSFGSEGEQKAAHAQMTLRPGFLVASETHAALVETGTAAWEAARLDGIEFLSPLAAWGVGPRLRFEGEPSGPSGMGRKTEWSPVETDGPGRSRREANGIFPTRLLEPSTIPAQRETPLEGVRLVHLSDPGLCETSGIPLRMADHLTGEVAAWEAMMAGGDPIVLAPGERRRAILRFPVYACVYPTARASGGAGSRVRVHVQEALFENTKSWDKGDRNAIEGKLFTTLWHNKDGIGDEFCPRGFKQDFRSFDWNAGVYAEVSVEAGERSLALFDVGFIETRYPLDLAGWPTTNDPELAPILAICRRAEEMSAHETFIDCAYERMQYVWDARIEGLCAMVFGADDRLVRKAITTFADSLLPNGLITSRSPSRERQVIAPFSLLFVGMLHDYARWRGDMPFIRERLHVAAATLDAYERSDHTLEGWSFVDWVPEWDSGMPPGAEKGHDPVIGMEYLIARRQYEELRAWCGVAALPEKAAVPAWILASERKASLASEHFAALSTLYGFEGKPLDGAFEARATFSFTHLLFEAYTKSGRTDLLRERILKDWGRMVANGLTTTIEQPEPTRSDCHGWGAHPAYHLLTGVLGLQPEGFGGTRFGLSPRLYDGVDLSASAWSARGPIRVSAREGRMEIEIPEGIVVATASGEIGGGRHSVALPNVVL